MADIPANLKAFLPGTEQGAAPAPAPAPKPAPQGGGFGGLIQSGVKAVEGAASAVGGAVSGLFKGKQAAPPAQKGLPDNLKQFVTPGKKGQDAAPAALPGSKVPANLQPYLQKKSDVKDSQGQGQSGPKNTGAQGLFNPPPVDDTTAQSTPQSEDGMVDVGENGSSAKVSGGEFAKDFISSIGPATWTTFKSLGQNINKTAAEIGVTLAQDEDPNVPGTVTDNTGKWQKAFGTSSIEGLAYQVSDLEQTIKNSAFAKKLGLDKHALPLAFAAVVGGDTLNLAPIGGEGDSNIVDALAKETTVESTTAILKSTGMSDNLISQLAPRFAEMTDKTEIKDGLETAKTLASAVSESAKEGAFDADTVTKPAETKPTSAEEANGTPTTHDTPEVAEAFDKSVPTQDIGTVGEAKIVLGTFGENAIARKTAAALPDRLPATELQHTLPNVNAVYKAGSSSFRKNNLVLLADMPDGTTRAIVTRQNAAGNEEVVNFFNVSRDKDAFVKNLESFGAPDQTRTGTLSLERSSSNPLSNGGTDSIPNVPTARTEGINTPSTMKSMQQLARERLATTLAKNEASRAEAFKTEHIPTASVRDEDQAHGLYQTEDSEDIKSGPFKGWSKTVAELYQYGFANKRKPDTIQIAGAAMKARFEPLRADGMDAIFKFEGFERDTEGRLVKNIESLSPSITGGSRQGLYGKAAEENDRMFAEERNAGVQQRGKLIQYRKNYLRIYIKGPDNTIYDGTSGEVIANARGGRRVSRNADFAIPRQFDTNAEAVAAGYELAFPNLPDLMAARAMEHQKAVADATLFNDGVKHGLVIPAPALSDDKSISGNYKMFDPDRFPQYRTQYPDRESGQIKQYVGPYYGPANFVDKVNNFLYDPHSGNVFQRGLAKTANFVGTTKNIALSIGIPNLSKLGLGKILAPILGDTAAERVAQIGSGYSLHFWNLLPRATLAEKAPLQYFRYAADPMAAQQYVQKNLDTALHYAEQGLTLSAEEHEASALDLKDLKTLAGAGRNFKAASEWLHGLFGEGIFGKVMPAMKLQGAQTRTADFVAKGFSQQEAERMAADTENHIWGGLNLDALGRNKDYQNFLRSILIAPDYAETNIKMGIRAAKSVVKWNDKSLAPYRNFMAMFATAYVAMNLMQYETSGSFMVQNDPMHIFSMKAGKDANGKTRYLNAFGTGVDWARIPAQIASAAINQDWTDITAVLNNRLSIPLDTIEELRTNTDWAGQRIFGNDIYGNPIPGAQAAGNIFDASIGSMLPSFSTSLVNVATGKTSGEQGLVQGLALPVGYVNETPNQSTINQMKADAKNGIASGDYTLFNQLVKAKVISARSRAAFIKDALTGTKTQAQQRTSAKDKARIKKEEDALVKEGLSKTTVE